MNLEKEYYISKLKTAIDNMDDAAALDTAKEYIRSGGNSYGFLEDVLRHLIMLKDEEWHGKLISLTDIYRISKVMETLVDYVMANMDHDLLAIGKKGRSAHILTVTFNDWHEFGRLIMATFFRSAGYKVTDAGMVSTLRGIAKEVVRNNPDVLAISVLMLNSALRLASLRRMLDETGCASLKIIAGGAPFYFDRSLVKRLNFDGCAEHPFEAISLVNRVTRLL